MMIRYVTGNARTSCVIFGGAAIAVALAVASRHLHAPSTPLDLGTPTRLRHGDSLDSPFRELDLLAVRELLREAPARRTENLTAASRRLHSATLDWQR